MIVAELNEKYHEELSWTQGDQELRYNLLSPLFQNLYENKAVYHERFTCIIQLPDIVISPESFRAKVRRLSLINPGVYQNMPIPENWTIGSNWAWLRLNVNCLSAYSSWVLWPDPIFVQKIEELIQENKLDVADNLIWGESK